MSCVVNAYSDRAYQEFILPETNNADYDVVLDREIFALREDVSVRLEVVDGVWRLVGADRSVVLTGGVLPGEALRDGDSIRLAIGQVGVGLVMSRFQPSLNMMKKYHVSLPCQVRIGQAADCDICYKDNPLVSQNHAVLTLNAGSCVVTDTSTNGVFVGSRRIHSACSLDFGECVNILGLQIVWLGGVLAVGCKGGTVDCRLQEMAPARGEPAEPGPRPCQAGPSCFRRSPRNMPRLYRETLEIEAPPQPQRAAKRPLLLTIGPSLTMALPMICGAAMAILASRSSGSYSGAFLYTGIVIAVMSALIGAMWALVNLRYSKKTERRNEQARVEKYREYLLQMEREIAARYDYNTQSLRYLYPSAADCAGYGAQSAELWNRNMSHEDFLYLRLGIGARPFQCSISVPKQRFSLIDDELAGQPKRLYDQFKNLKDVPVGVDLWADRLVGIVGEDAGAAAAVMRLLAVQIAANNCYTDVKMVFLFDGRTPGICEQWAFARWFPHTWSEDKRVRFFAADQHERSEVCYALANLFRARAEDDRPGGRRSARKPHYVVFVERAELLEGEPVASYLLQPTEALGVSTVLMAERFEQLPNSCVHIVENDRLFRGVFNTETGDGEKQAVAFDALGLSEAEQLARRLAAVEVSETEAGGEIPASVTFLDLYHVGELSQLNVMDRWKKNRTYENMRVPIGRKAGGADWYLDIHEKYHGPHGLVAGTTGSGKSETLQTYILSLAVNFSPEDVAFFLIDFKGGGMANLFAGLPHTAGYISNLSGNQIHRAMVSIKSENRRRQRLFGELGVNHIDQYTRLFKHGEAPVPIPHLFIVIDEFAELKRDEPDFMRELISVAQVGRSLGVHLILATQKPSGTVDDNIWSNTRFRLCLRVQDRQDSNDMLHKPDAAYITQAGRCYMQVGNDEIYELFQSGWSGAVYEAHGGAAKAEQVTMWSNTGRSSAIGSSQKAKRIERQRLEWLTALAGYLDEAAAEMALPLAACLEEEKNAKALFDAVCDRIERSGYDFPRSKANFRRLSDFAAWLSAAPSDPSHPQARAAAAMVGLRAQGKLLPEEREKTQLTAAVEYLAQLAQESGKVRPFRLWLPVLPTELYLDDVQPSARRFDGSRWPAPAGQWTLETAVGLYDDPANQSQQPFVLDLAQSGHLAVCGAVVSGKSTFLQTFLYGLAERYSPEQVNIYALDYSNRMLSCFEGLCHVGGVTGEDSPDKTAKCFALISSILAQRKKLFQGGSFSQYLKVNGPGVPAIVVAIDNYANFKEKTENRFEDVLLTLSREGVNHGIFLVITAGGFGAAELQSRIADNIRTVVCLEMGDRLKYTDVLRTMHIDVLPEANVKGRGLASIGGTILEYQTALALAADDDYARAEKMTRRFEAMNRAWKGKPARQIPVIPSQPVWPDLLRSDDMPEFYAKDSSLLPYGWYSKDASIASIDLAHTYCWLITGRARTGKSNLIKALASSAAQIPSERYIFDLSGDRLERFAEENGARYISGGQEMFSALKALIPIFQERNARKRELVQSGMDESDIYQEMRAFPPVFLFIDHLDSFVGTAYRPPEGVGAMSGFLENAAEKGFLHNIYLIAAADVADIPKMAGRKLFEAISSYKTGIHLGGNVASQRIFDFSSMPYTEQTKAARPGLGLVPPGEYEDLVREVTIPNVKG